LGLVHLDSIGLATWAPGTREVRRDRAQCVLEGSQLVAELIDGGVPTVGQCGRHGSEFVERGADLVSGDVESAGVLTQLAATASATSPSTRRLIAAFS